MKIEDTIFGKYDTILFDLDGTLWDCFTPKGESMGAYKTTPPYKRVFASVATDINNNIIRVQRGVPELLNALDAADINLGIVSRSELEDKPFSAQPAIMLLKLFDLYKYFNYQISLKLTMEKSEYVKPLGKTLFIDDEQENTNAVNQSGKADVLWRGAFGDWDQLMSPVNSVLSFAIAASQKHSREVVPEYLEGFEVGNIITDGESGDYEILEIHPEELVVRTLTYPFEIITLDRDILKLYPPQFVRARR